MIAGIGIAGLLTLNLATAARAQSNTELTQAVVAEINNWKAQSYNTVRVESVASNAGGSVESGSREVKVSRKVTQLPSGAYQLTISAPRQTLLTEPLAAGYCDSALGTPKENCFTLSGTMSASAYDKLPVLPSGITVNVEQLPPMRGLKIVDLDVAALRVVNDNLDLRVALKPSGGRIVADGAWNITLTCSDQTSLAGTPDSSFVRSANGSEWLTARMSVSGASALAGSCRPQLWLWTEADPQPKPIDIANDSSGNPEIKAWSAFKIGS
jgi:hypothetical protein